MLKPAQLYKNELDQLLTEIWYEEKYKFWNNGVWYETQLIEDTTWSRHQFVSVNRAGEVIGYISYNIDRACNKVDGLSIINFSDDIVTFGHDLRTVIDDIFIKFNFRKICFSVVCGNPIEDTYDRLIHKYGGRIIGVSIDDVKLIDGKLYNTKTYEIFNDEYLVRKFK